MKSCVEVVFLESINNCFFLKQDCNLRGNNFLLFFLHARYLFDIIWCELLIAKIFTGMESKARIASIINFKIIRTTKFVSWVKGGKWKTKTKQQIFYLMIYLVLWWGYLLTTMNSIHPSLCVLTSRCAETQRSHPYVRTQKNVCTLDLSKFYHGHL